jgi:MarR family transcriptional regulator, transcriptional regulator for hemolysin
VFISLKGQRHGTQREIAEAVGIEGPTLTHHLNRMERDGLVTRVREPDNRRAHLVALTDAGAREFGMLVRHVQVFDRRLRAGFSDEELAALRHLLDRVVANAAGAGGETWPPSPTPKEEAP